jgi:site-specific DNA recombinase
VFVGVFTPGAPTTGVVTAPTAGPGATNIQRTWDHVLSILQQSPRLRANNTRSETPALLKGLLYGPDGAAFSPSHTRKGDRLYRYYVSQTVLKHGVGKYPVARVPAAEIEAAVIDQIRGMLRAPEVVMSTWRTAQLEHEGLTEDDVREALASLELLWAELFPAEQARIIQLLIERVDIGTDGLKLRFREKGLAQMVTEIGMIAGKDRKAAA